MAKISLNIPDHLLAVLKARGDISQANREIIERYDALMTAGRSVIRRNLLPFEYLRLLAGLLRHQAVLSGNNLSTSLKTGSYEEMDADDPFGRSAEDAQFEILIDSILGPNDISYRFVPNYDDEDGNAGMIDFFNLFSFDQLDSDVEDGEYPDEEFARAYLRSWKAAEETCGFEIQPTDVAQLLTHLQETPYRSILVRMALLDTLERYNRALETGLPVDITRIFD